MGFTTLRLSHNQGLSRQVRRFPIGLIDSLVDFLLLRAALGGNAPEDRVTGEFYVELPGTGPLRIRRFGIVYPEMDSMRSGDIERLAT